jgi:hypothetical protein
VRAPVGHEVGRGSRRSRARHRSPPGRARRRSPRPRPAR